MRIAIDCHTLELKNWAGKERLLFNALESLKRLDGENEYCLYFRRSVFPPDFFPARWIGKIIRLPAPFWQISVLIHCLFINPADLLFIPSTYLLPAITRKIFTVIIVHDLAVFIPEIKKMSKFSTRLKEKLFLRPAVKKARAIVAVSKNTKNDIIKYLHIDSQKIFVVYPGVNSFFKPSPDSDESVMRSGSLTLPSRFILALNTLEPRKNITNILRAYRLVGDFTYPLLVVGKKGWHYQEIFSLAEKLGLTDKVIFTGYLPDGQLPDLYRHARYLIYPSLYEGFGLPVLEALACACPVITSRTSSLPEVAGQAAIFVDPYSVEEIAAAMRSLSGDEELAAELRRKGLEQVRKFSSDDFARNLLNIFKIVKHNQSLKN